MSTPSLTNCDSLSSFHRFAKNRQAEQLAFEVCKEKTRVENAILYVVTHIDTKTVHVEYDAKILEFQEFHSRRFSATGKVTVYHGEGVDNKDSASKVLILVFDQIKYNQAGTPPDARIEGSKGTARLMIFRQSTLNNSISLYLRSLLLNRFLMLDSIPSISIDGETVSVPDYSSYHDEGIRMNMVSYGVVDGSFPQHIHWRAITTKVHDFVQRVVNYAKKDPLTLEGIPLGARLTDDDLRTLRALLGQATDQFHDRLVAQIAQQLSLDPASLRMPNGNDDSIKP